MFKSRLINGWPFVIPGLLFTCLITFGPIVYVFVQSVQRVRLHAFYDRPFMGLRNYSRILNDVVVIRSIYITIIYTILVTVFCILIGLFISNLINKSFVKRKNVLLAIYLLPFVITHVVTGLIFRILILEPSYGLLNNVVNALFDTNISTAWVVNPDAAFPVVVAVSVWKLSPLAILILYAALSTIPHDLIEAASIDGARSSTIFRRIVYPLLHKHVFVVALILMTSAFRQFDVVLALTGGGPGFRTMVLSILIYLRGTQAHNYGIASAISVVMFVIIGVLTISFIIVFNKLVDKDL